MIVLIITIIVILCNPAKSSEILTLNVNRGFDVMLNCGSNDRNHSFYFWAVENPRNLIIGPGNVYDRDKYEYEVLTGRLIVKRIADNQEGSYTCVSRGVRHDNINSNTVMVTIADKQSKKNEYDDDLLSVAVFKFLTVFGSFAVLLMASYMVYLKNIDEVQKEEYFMSGESEESGGEEYDAPSTSAHNIGKIVTDFAEIAIGYENRLLDDDKCEDD